MLIIKINADQSAAKTAVETANEIVYRETEPRPISQSHKKKKKEVLEEHNESGQL